MYVNTMVDKRRYSKTPSLTQPNPTSHCYIFFYLLMIIYLFIYLFMNLFIYTPCCENRKPYITELETKWFMIASDHKGGTNNKSNLQPIAS